jgi:Smr domain.
MTKKYLLTKHKEAFISEPVKHKLTPKKRVSYTIRKSEQIKIMEDETVDQILKEMTYEQIRDKVIQLSKIKLILERTAAQARAFNKYNEVHSLESAAKQQAQFLIKYSKASKKYLLDKARRNNEFFEIDLHGLYWEEAKDVITQQINYVWAKVDAEESKCKFDEKIINGRRYIKYTVITGKGNHSRHGVPVLYNNLCNFLKEKDILFDAEKNEGQIIVYIKI